MESNTASLMSWRSLYRFFAVIAVMFLAYHALDTGIYGLRYFANYTWPYQPQALLLTHIGTGFVALILGPWQFWKALRNKYRKLHRWTGRLYLGSVAMSSAAGLYMGITTVHGLVFSTGIIGLALAWMITGTFAYLYIRNGLVDEHRYWMICNYVVTFGFVTYRLGNSYLEASGVEFVPRTVMAWLCWVPQLSVTVLILHLKQSRLFSRSTNRRISKKPIEA